MEKKMTLSFGFSKTKAKTTLVQTTATKLLDDTNKSNKAKGDEPNGEIEMITSLEGKKIQTVNKSSEDKNKPLVIPCKKNEPVFDVSKALEKKLNEGKVSQEDAEAVKALIQDTKAKSDGNNDSNLKIPLNEQDKKEELENIEDPDYETVDIEQFGMAALRGMGWTEKTGIGLTNKRSSALFVPEVRPKGLGLGAGVSTKKMKLGEEEDNKSSNQDNTLKYAKGAYVQILSGKHQDEYGQLVSFDDGLNRILIKLHDSGDTISIIQSLTKLVSKTDYTRATERTSRR